MKPKFMWAGVVDEKIDISDVDTGWGGFVSHSLDNARQGAARRE